MEKKVKDPSAKVSSDQIIPFLVKVLKCKDADAVPGKVLNLLEERRQLKKFIDDFELFRG